MGVMVSDMEKYNGRSVQPHPYEEYRYPVVPSLKSEVADRLPAGALSVTNGCFTFCGINTKSRDSNFFRWLAPVQETAGSKSPVFAACQGTRPPLGNGYIDAMARKGVGLSTRQARP